METDTSKSPKSEDIELDSKVIEEIKGHAALFRPIDPEPGPVDWCPYCGKRKLKAVVDSPLGEYLCQDCKKQFDIRSGIGGVRQMRSFIVPTQEGPKCIIGPQHLEHLLETDTIEIAAAGWFGDAAVGMGHALRLGVVPRVELDDLGIVVEDMEVIIITSSVWHHKQYAKVSGYFMYYHPDALFSEIRSADIFLATKLGLLLDTSEKQKLAIFNAYLEGNFDSVKMGSRMAALQINTWAAGDEAARPEPEEEEGWWWGVDWKLCLAFIFFVVVLAIALKVWGFY